MKEIYLDNAATTKARKEVVNYMVDCMEHSYANACLLYTSDAADE